MKRLLSLLNNRGAAAIEFAMLAPVLILGVVGVSQMSMIFFAKTGLRNAVAEAARFATIWPRPTDAQITAKIDAKKFGLKSSNLVVHTPVHGGSGSTAYVDISATYTVPFKIVMVNVTPVTLTYTRRAYQQPAS
jgi:Flp pilus assembly pilin Flp